MSGGARQRCRSRGMHALLAVIGSLSCAVSVPPAGGPEDREPPTVIRTNPAADSSGVAPSTAVEFEFSESVIRTGLVRQVKFEPAVQIGDVKWGKRTVSISALGGFQPDTTYVVTLKSGYRDAHRVAATADYRFAFATSAHVDSGVISGSVRFKRKPTDQARVQCYALPLDSTTVPGISPANRTAIPAKDGTWKLDYLGTRDMRYLVWAWAERNRNDQFDPDDDVALAVPDTVRLTERRPATSGLLLSIIDPDEPGELSGAVTNQSGVDTAMVRVSLFSAERPAIASYVTNCAPDGAYHFIRVAPGTYALFAFVDILPDSACGNWPCGPDSTTCAEPCAAAADSIVVGPGEKAVVPPLTLQSVPEAK